MSIGDSKLQAMLNNVDKKAEKILDFENDDIIKNLQYEKEKAIYDYLSNTSLINSKQINKVNLFKDFEAQNKVKNTIDNLNKLEQEYKANKLNLEYSNLNNSYIDEKGNITSLNSKIDPNMSLEDYSLLGAVKNAATSGTANLLQGGGKILQSATNGLGMLGEMGLQALDDITSPHDPNRFNSKDYKDIIKKWDNNTIGALGVANAIAKPLNEAAKKINYKNLSSTDDIHQAFSEGIWDGTKELGSAIAHTLIGSAPEVAPALFGVVPGIVAGAGSFMARADKERQAKALGVSPDDIMEVSPNMTPEDLIGGAIYGGLNLVDASILKNAVGKGLISKLSDRTIGLSSKADNATKNAFAKLRESSPRLDAWLKPQGAGAKAVAWSADKAWKLGKTTGKVGGKVGIAAGLEGGAEMGQTLMEQWANGDLKDRSWDENWKDIKEAGLMGAYVGGSLKAPHAVYQEGKGKLESAFNSKKETKALEKYTPAANKVLAGGNTLFDKLDDEKFAENLSKEDIENYKADFNDIINTSPDASIDDINNFLNDENNRDAVIKTIYLAKNGKLGSDAAKSIIESHNNLVNTILSDSNPNEAILNSKSILEKIMYAVNLRDTNFVRGLFNSAISKSNKDILNSPENGSNEVARILETYIAIMENLRDTLSRGIEQTKSLLGNTYSETKDKASLAYMNKMINTVKKTPTQVGMEIIKSGFTTMDGNKKESVSDYMNFLDKTNDIDALRNKKTKLETYRNNHRAKATLYQFLKDSKPIKQGNIAVIPRFSTNPNDIRVMSKQEFENELKRTNTPRNHFTIFESRFSNPKSYQTGVENLLNSIQNELDIMEQTYSDYEYKINRVSKQNSQNTTDNSSNKQDSKSNEKPKQEQSSTQSKQESKESETKSENKKSSNDSVTQEERIKENTSSSNSNSKPSEVKGETKPEQTSDNNSEQTIDIYSTNKDKWSYLTNVTKSPLVLNIGRRSYLFSSVEHAYQSLKHNDFSKPRSQWTLAEVYNKDWSNSKKIKSELKENRENDSNIKIMKYLLEERAKQDSKFKELLKETGNDTLTHNKDNTIWKSEFPKLLMEIRDNLNNENRQENTSSSNVEKEVSNENLDITKSNSVNISEDNSIISFLKNNIKKSEIILKAIENIEKVFNSENVKKIKTFAFALGDKVDLNKNTRSQLANINNLSNIENLINNVFEKGYLDKFKENYSNLLESIKKNYNRNLSTGSYTFKLDSYSVAKKSPKGDEIISTAPGAILLHDKRTMVSMALRGIETLLSIQFNTQYRSVTEMQEHLEKVFGKDSKIHISNYDILKTLNETSIESSLLSDIGRNIINDLGIKWKDKEVGEIQQSYVEQELGRYTLDILEKMGLIERYSIKNKEIFEESNDQEAQINLIKVKERLFSNERDKSNSPRVMLDKLNNIFEQLGLDRNNNRVSYKFGKGFGKLWDNWGKTTKGKDKKLYKKAAKAIQISRNTKFVAKSKDYLMSFLKENFNGSNPADILIKASEGYTPNLQEKIDKLQSALQHGEVNDDALVLFSEIESKKGKNLGIENEVNNLLELITNPEIDNGVFFDYRISKNEREFMQSDGANPQAHKISRFLVVPEYLFSQYTKGKNGEIIGKNGQENVIAYQHIAQAFGMGTDKVASEKSIAFGKSILALDFTKLEKAIAEAMKNGKQEFEVDGIELSIAELGHALSAMAALNSYHNAKVGENFEAAILGEADGINNGIAIKLLQYMLHPKYVELLKGTGIDFFNQLSDNISDYFSGKTYDEKSGEKLLDLYQIIAKQFNSIVDNAIKDIDTTINNTKNGLSQKNKKIKNLLNNKSANNAISTITKNLTYTLHDLFKLNPDGSIAKSARTFVKPMVQVFGYGAGDKSQINGLINAFMETFERKVLDYIDSNKQENKFYYDTIKAVYFLVHGNLPNNEEEIKKVIKNDLIYGVKQISSKGTEYIVPLLNAKTKTENITGFDIIKNILETQLTDTIVETMQNTFPGIREQSQLINEITNERIELVQKHYERLKNTKLKFLKENGENREYLTKQELEEIRDNIQKFLPGMTLSIASIEELGDIEAKHYFENTKSQTNLNGMNSQSFLGSGKGKDNATINPKETVYLDNGAGTNVIAIHQRDGSAMLTTVVETAKKIENRLQRIFLGVHDALVTDANSSLEIQNEINKISYEMDINNNQLAQFEDIARKNIIIAEDLIKGIPDEHTQKERLDIEVKKLTAKFQTYFRKVSEYNREILSRYKVSYNNIQNGNKGSAYILNPDNPLNNNIRGQELKNLLIPYTDGQLIIINALDTFKTIKAAIRANEKDLFGNIGFRENELALKPIKEELADTIDMVDAAIEKLEILMDKKLKSLDNKNTDNSQNVDNFKEISFNTKYENTINAITRAINRNNIEGIKEAYEAVNGNEKGFRTAINKYLNSLDNMSESYKTNFKNKIKEALNIDIDKKLSGSKKAREEIEENITDENLKEALNKEIDNSFSETNEIEENNNIETFTQNNNSTNDEFKDFKIYDNSELGNKALIKTMKETKEIFNFLGLKYDKEITKRIYKYAFEESAIEYIDEKSGQKRRSLDPLANDINSFANALGLDGSFDISRLFQLYYTKSYKNIDDIIQQIKYKTAHYIMNTDYLGSNAIEQNKRGIEVFIPAKNNLTEENRQKALKAFIRIDNAIKAFKYAEEYAKNNNLKFGYHQVMVGKLADIFRTYWAALDLASGVFSEKEFFSKHKEILEIPGGKERVYKRAEDFKQSNNVLNSPENKNNKNKLNSVENTEQNNNDTETTAIPILDEIQSNPNAISEMQDNLRDLDKQNGRSIDEEHSNILKEVLNKITGTLSQSVGNLKVLLSNTNATNNAGEYNREINAITIKHSTNPRYSGYMGAELTYAHEMVHAATSFAVRYMQGNNKFTHMLRTAYDLFLHNANAETIAEHLTQIPNIQERHRIANMLFNHMTKNEDSLTNLEEFLAIALTDKAMIEILQSIPYKEESKTLFQKIRDSFFEIFDTIFGDNILKVKKNGSTYDMLVSLAAQMGKINQNAKNEVTKNKSKLREIIDFAREEMDEKLSGVISTSLTPVKKFLVKEMATNTSDSWLGHIRYHAASSVLAMCSKDYQDNLRKELSDTYIALNNDTMLGAIIDDISTPSAMARLAQRAQRESSRIDAKRESYEYFTEQTLKKFFKNPISEYEAQAMGEVLLDMDIVSLDMDINDIQSLLSNEAMLNDKIKEFKNKINSKNLDQKYKNYIHNRSIALAYKMVTGKNIDNAVALNAYNIVNCVGTNNRYSNPSTKYNKEFKNELVKDVDQYITLLALKLMDKGTKESVANVINKDLEATKKVMNFIKNFNKNSQKDLFKDNKIQTIKGYRRDVYNNDKEIIWADASREKELAKEGYKRISKPLSKNASDNTNDTRCMYVNTFISKQTNFTRQAIRYTKGTSRGHELRDLINHEIYENPERVNELERLYHKSMAEAKENFKRDINKAMNIEIPLDIKILEDMSKETNLQPILDEVGNVASFSYQMSKEVKKDVLALNTNIFKSLGKMQANYYDKNASRDLNNRIVEILANDYKVASKNPLELDKMFIELSHDTKDPLKREIYKMLDYETRTKLEKEMGGKIMIRKDTFAKFFGVRDMDVRNAKWFKKMSNVEVKKTIIFTAELLKMITKLFKLETVVRTPSVFIANQVSNIWQCMNYGIPLLDSLKLHREAVANLRRYQEGRRKLIELELKVSAGEKVNEASINALRTSLKNNPVYPLVAHGFLNTIIEDLDKPAKGYFEEKYSEFYNNRSSIGKGIIDWAFLTEKTFVGKALTEYVHMADFLSRYTLYYGLKNQGKLNETQIIDEVSDAFIDYDMITNRGIKMLNDYGFALFTRFFTRSQRFIKNHFVDRPFTTAALLVTQSHVGDVFNDSVYDTVFWNKNYDYMLGLANPIYNAIDVLSPSGLKFVPGMSDVMSTASLRSSSMFI